MSGSMNVTFSRRRYVSVFLAVCNDAPDCAVLLQGSRSSAGILHGCQIVYATENMLTVIFAVNVGS